MRNLFNFIIRNSHWLVAILLVAFSFYLVFAHNSYQRSVYLTSANRVTGWFYTVSGNLSSFLLLKKNNRELLERNAQLEQELYAWKAERDSLDRADTPSLEAFVADSLFLPQFGFIPAEVVNLSFSGVNNFITINKGSKQRVKPDMGVISHRGVVGVVSHVSANFAVVIPVINPKFRLSARLKHSENNGSLSWDGRNIREAQVQELPRHESFREGDTVMTSFSRIFPKNLIIGTVSGRGESADDNFVSFNLQLATDFYTLQDVLVIEDRFFEEQKALETMMQR
ncbi:MAG: rod shape-determining protein MreC [bacterium]|nr:rod shape-determining protein MreC [bacterium]MDD3624108.1 rod shape-determining protein MreC [Proteiniphilum sp.]MDD3967710.1 rod shape-determining protein MreC [Proteiniphilum sp.]MDD4458945.1 rod shape-determining protein MreC [Proteiniphilum sp.]